jgi:uncharacterized RDD family membrane protein YckC
MNETPSAPAASAVAENIDLVLLAIVGGVMSVAFGESNTEGSSFELNLSGAPFLIYIAICFGYFFILENATGQTLGKKSMNIKVIAVEGPLTTQKVAIRTILRVVDGFPWIIPNLLGTVVAATSSKHQRIGDMAASTLVVRT